MKKGGFYGLRGKEFSLVTIGLMCVAIIILSWEKTPLLNTFPPPQTRLQLNTDTLNDALIRSSPLEQQDHTVKGQQIPRVVSHSSLSDEEMLPTLSKGSPASSREAKHEDIAELKTDRSPENFVEDETIHNQEGVEEGLKVPITKGGLKPERVNVEGKIKQVVEENYSRQGEQGVHSELPISHNVSKRDSGESTPILERNQACNYAKGKWVVDNKQPLYSGFRCKQWLSPMWACRLTQRTDFAYEKLRWQPKSCQMERFKSSEFLKRMQHKTLAFVGDSLGRQQFQSLMCMATGGEEQHVVDVGNEFGLILAPGDTRPSGWAYRFPSTNTTILYYWSASLCDVEPLDRINRDTDFAMHLDRPPAFLRRYINKIDVLVLNTGHHWNRGKLKANRWVMHVGGKPNNDRKLAMIWNAKNFTIHSTVDWVNSQLPKYPGLKAFYRTISPRHFVGGDWNTGGSCDNTTPMSIGKELLQDESSDESAAGAVKGTGVTLLDITALSQLRDEAHISHYSRTAKIGVQDCLHWCLPGLPDTWNEILYAQI